MMAVADEDVPRAGLHPEHRQDHGRGQVIMPASASWMTICAPVGAFMSRVARDVVDVPVGVDDGAVKAVLPGLGDDPGVRPPAAGSRRASPVSSS